MTELKAIIFDVDGTLANTEEAHRIAFNYAFEKAGLSWNWDVELYTKLLKVTGGKERIKYYVSEFLKETIEHDLVVSLHEAKNAQYQAIIQRKELPLRSGILPLINQCRENNMKIAIATTTSPGNVRNLVTATMGDDALDWFEVIADAEVAPVKKPAPDVYEYVLEKMYLRAEECVALEDSYNGVAAATSIKIPTLITVNNYTAHDDFTGAMLVVDELGDENTPCHVLAAADSIDKSLINGPIDLDRIKKLHKSFVG